MNAFKTTFIFLILVISTTLLSQTHSGISFTNPLDGSTHTITSGTTIQINVTFDFYVTPPFAPIYINLTDHNGTVYENIESGSVTISVGPGSYTWRLDLGAYDQGSGTWEFPWDESDFTVVVGEASITANNNFNVGQNHGSIRVDDEDKIAPYTFGKNVNDNAKLEALRQNDEEGYVRDWNVTKPNLRSLWKYTKGSTVINKEENNPFSFTVVLDDDNATYTGYSRILYQIYRDDQTEFDATIPSGFQTEICEQNSGNISAPATQTINGKLYNFSFWTDNFAASNNRTVTPPDNTTYTSFYKYKQHSNSVDGYSTSSQRKFVRTDDGFLHYAYESVGKVWYEMSTDGGTTWNIMNNGKPLSNGSNAKSPSIDYLGNCVLIVYQIESTIEVDCFSKGLNPNVYNFSDYLIVDEFVDGLDYAQDSYPVISIGGGGNAEGYFFVITWRICQGETIYPPGAYGLFCKLGKYFHDSKTIFWANDYPSQFITGTDVNSQNPSIAVNKIDEYVEHKLVWQQNRDINYVTLTPIFTTPQIIDIGTPTTASTNSGFTFNHYPSISLNTNDTPIISWRGSTGSGIEKNLAKGQGVSSVNLQKVVVRSGLEGNYFYGGDDVNYVNSNSSSSGDNTVIIWSEGTTPVSKWVKRVAGSYTNTTNLSHSGIQTQVSNGATINLIKAMVFNTQSLPYPFTFVNDNFDAIIKPPGYEKIKSGGISLTFGRSGIVGKNGVQFVFNIGDIVLADTNVQFIPKPDTILYTNTDELNQVTRSLTFHLDNQSDLYFTNFYYTVNPEIADSALTDDDAVTFRAELVNAVTNTVEGTFDEITYTKNNLNEYDNVNYQVDCSGIDDGDYYLRLVTSVVGEANYNLANVQNDNPGLAKRNYKNVNFTGSETPTTYDLSQNYPNPFNPSTSINYQIPKTGLVTIKVYDILGREVATLVNEQKTQGRYSINFDASSAAGGLASGVYIYQIRANDYVSSKKMLLLK